MIPLWDFQHDILKALRLVYRNGARAPLLVSPTGSGKTVMFCHMALNHLKRGGRVLILVHRQELTQQVSDTLQQFHVEHGFIAAGFPDRVAEVNVASVFTLIKRLDTLDWAPTLIIVDEAHHAAASTWSRILKQYPDAHVLGVTATPVRLSGEGLGEAFDVMVQGPQTQELIDRGFLSPFRAYCPTAPDLTGVRRRLGEFVQSDLVAKVDRPNITGSAVEHYRSHGKDGQGVAFCVSVEHAHHVAAQFKDARYSAACIDGSMPTEWRRQMVADFRRRELRLLTSCDLISEGFDCPGIEVGISLRPTHSMGLWRQQMGRCLRISPGKTEAILLDCAGNAMRHGLPSEDIAWTLNGKQTVADGGGKKVRVCPKCWGSVRAGARACHCGHVFEVAPRVVAGRAGELYEVTPEEVEAARKKKARVDLQNFHALKTLGIKRGYKDPEAWARQILAGQKAKKTRGVTVNE